MGLGALYLLHVLAKDYMKIRKPVQKLAKFLLTKRDLDAVSRNATDEVVRNHRNKTLLPFFTQDSKQIGNLLE